MATATGGASLRRQSVANVIQARDKKGRRFYYHCPTGTSSWFRPRLQAVAADTAGAVPVLPLGAPERAGGAPGGGAGAPLRALPPDAVVLWAEKRDRKRRKVYLNTLTGKASWSRPPSHCDVDLAAVALLTVEDVVGPEGEEDVAQRPAADAASGASDGQQAPSAALPGAPVGEGHGAGGAGQDNSEGAVDGAGGPRGGSALRGQVASAGGAPGTAANGGEGRGARPPPPTTARPRLEAVAEGPSGEGAGGGGGALALARRRARPPTPPLAGTADAVPPLLPRHNSKAASPEGLLEQRRSARRRRATFNPFAAVTQLAGHGEAEEAAAIRASLVQHSMLRPDARGRLVPVAMAPPVEAAEAPAALAGEVPRRGGAAQEEATAAGDILWREGISMSPTGRLQRSASRGRLLPPAPAPASAAAPGSERDGGHSPPRARSGTVEARAHAAAMLRSHASPGAPGWATARPGTASAGTGVAVGGVAGGRGGELPTPPGGAGWSWDGGTTLSDSTSYMWDGDASELRAAGAGAEEAARLGGPRGVGGIGAAAPATPGAARLAGGLVNVHALVEAAAEGQVVWVETVDQGDGQVGAVPFVRAGGAVLRGSMLPRAPPVGSPGAPGGEGHSVAPAGAALLAAGGGIPLVQWTGDAAAALPPRSPAAGASPPSTARSRVIAAVTQGAVQPAAAAQGSGGAPRPPAPESVGSLASTLGPLSAYSGDSSASWLPPAPGPLYVLGRPLTAGDLSTLYGGGRVDTNLVSGDARPRAPPSRRIGDYDYHEALPAGPAAGAAGSASSPASPASEGEEAFSTHMSPRVIASTAASDYAAASMRRPSFAVSKRAPRGQGGLSAAVAAANAASAAAAPKGKPPPPRR